MNGLLTSIWGTWGPSIVDGVVTLAVPAAVGLGVKLFSKWGVQITDSNRASLTAAAQRAAGELFVGIQAGHVDLGTIVKKASDGTSVPNLSNAVVVEKVQSVMDSAPSAIKKFGLSGDPAAVASKIVGQLGVLLAGAKK